MASSPRRMRLTPDHVQRITQPVDDPGPMPGYIPATDEDHEATMGWMFDALDDPPLPILLSH